MSEAAAAAAAAAAYMEYSQEDRGNGGLWTRKAFDAFFDCNSMNEHSISSAECKGSSRCDWQTSHRFNDLSHHPWLRGMPDTLRTRVQPEDCRLIRSNNRFFRSALLRSSSPLEQLLGGLCIFSCNCTPWESSFPQLKFIVSTEVGINKPEHVDIDHLRAVIASSRDRTSTTSLKPTYWQLEVEMSDITCWSLQRSETRRRQNRLLCW